MKDLEDTRVWKTQKGVEIKIADMSDSHLRNTILLLRSKKERFLDEFYQEDDLVILEKEYWLRKDVERLLSKIGGFRGGRKTEEEQERLEEELRKVADEAKYQ